MRDRKFTDLRVGDTVLVPMLIVGESEGQAILRSGKGSPDFAHPPSETTLLARYPTPVKDAGPIAA